MPRPEPAGLVAAFIPARHFTAGDPDRTVDFIVLHDMEAPERTGVARDVARWFAGPEAPQASAHYCVDGDEVVQCVRLADVAWHAPGANRRGIGVELAGYARQSEAEWQDAYSARMLGRAAQLVASLCEWYGVPAAFVDAAGLAAGRRGLTTHREVTRWQQTPGGHEDPGPAFPVSLFVATVRGYLRTS